MGFITIYGGKGLLDRKIQVLDYNNEIRFIPNSIHGKPRNKIIITIFDGPKYAKKIDGLMIFILFGFEDSRKVKYICYLSYLVYDITSNTYFHNTPSF